MDMRPEQALEELKRSVLFDPSFPKRIRCTADQYERLTPAEQQAHHTLALQAIERAEGHDGRLSELIRLLGRTRHADAVPALAQLWLECPLMPIRPAVGHALYEIATVEAWNVLAERLDDDDFGCRYQALQVIFARQPHRAFDALEGQFQHSAGLLIASEVLQFLAFNGFGPNWSVSSNDGAQKALREDHRWLDLCAGLIRDDHLGDGARRVLHGVPADLRGRALARIRESDRKRPPLAPRIQRDGRLRARYQSGEFEGVWREIRAYPCIDGDFREEVLEVAISTMRRVAENADILADRLKSRGWQARSSAYGGLRTPPAETDDDDLRRIVEITASPIPPTLLAFWKIVGGINWVWDCDLQQDHLEPNTIIAKRDLAALLRRDLRGELNSTFPEPAADYPFDLGVDLPMDEMDPLCVVPPSGIQRLFDEWIDQKTGTDPELIDPFRIELSPDYLHKACISGGSPYCILVPFLGGDPIFSDERHQLPFTDYLRLAFKWAGFPGLEEHAARDDVRRFTSEFGAGLVPF